MSQQQLLIELLKEKNRTDEEEARELRKAMFVALEWNNIHLLNILLQIPQCDPNVFSSWGGGSLLYTSLKRKNVDFAVTIIKSRRLNSFSLGFVPNIPPIAVANQQHRKVDSDIDELIRQDRLSVLQLVMSSPEFHKVVEAILDVEDSISVDVFKQQDPPVLCIAAAKGCEQIIRTLITRLPNKVDVNDLDHQGNHAASYAMQNGHMNCALALIEYGAILPYR
jgi:hypothetical protein